MTKLTEKCGEWDVEYIQSSNGKVCMECNKAIHLTNHRWVNENGEDVIVCDICEAELSKITELETQVNYCLECYREHLDEIEHGDSLILQNERNEV